MKLKRYKPGDAKHPGMVRDTLGGWVMFTDYAAEAARLDYLIDWLGHNEDVRELPVRDWIDAADARAAIDVALRDNAQRLEQRLAVALDVIERLKRGERVTLHGDGMGFSRNLFEEIAMTQPNDTPEERAAFLKWYESDGAWSGSPCAVAYAGWLAGRAGA